MGGDLASGIFGLLAGDPTTKQEHELNNLGAFDTGAGENLTNAAEQFDLGILSGDPSKIASTLAPEISTGQNQVQQQAKSNAEFGTRSGGTAASTENAEAANRGNIINLEGGLQSGTAANAGSLGSNLLSQATTNTTDSATLANDWAKTQQADVGQTAKGAAAVAGGFDAAPDVASAAGADPLGEMGSAPTTVGLSGISPEAPIDLTAFA